ncbi:MAG: hypothetical protein EBX95_06930 [Acidimicrobiia bacterium]|nr:hypothetical protein [Acidimicrobiia bacterium]
MEGSPTTTLAKAAPTEDDVDASDESGGGGSGVAIGVGVVAAAAIGGAIAFRKRRMQGGTDATSDE